MAHLTKIGRLRWAEHLARMNNDEVPKILLEEKIFGLKRVVRTRLSLVDCVHGRYGSCKGIRNWKAAEKKPRRLAALREALTFHEL